MMNCYKQYPPGLYTMQMVTPRTGMTSYMFLQAVWAGP